MKTILVVHSGGLDSTTCLLMALEQGAQVVSLGFNYGQRNVVELDFAERQCNERSVPRKVLNIGWSKPKCEMPRNRSVGEMKLGVSPAFLPGRNAIFLTLGCAEAMGIGADEVWTGINSIDFSGYPDCRPEFLEAFKTMIALAIPNGPKIKAPLSVGHQQANLSFLEGWNNQKA